MIAAAQDELGLTEARLETNRRAEALLRGRRKSDYAPWAAVLTLKTTRGQIASALGDHGGAAGLYESAAEPTPDQPPLACQQCSAGAWFQAANEHAANHDPVAARSAWSRGAALQPNYAPLMEASLALANAAAVEDAAAALAVLDGPVLAPYRASAGAAFDMTTYRPLKASLLIDLGRLAEAEALIAPTSRSCFDCVLVRAALAEASRRFAEADRLYRAAEQLGPSLPQAPNAWGEALLRRGQHDAAIVQFRKANALGPRWAHPLKLWGDALLAKGDARDAASRYADAADRAPAWGALQMSWGLALDAMGDRARADDRYRAASALSLSWGDRAAVTSRLARP